MLKIPRKNDIMLKTETWYWKSYHKVFVIVLVFQTKFPNLYRDTTVKKSSLQLKVGLWTILLLNVRVHGQLNLGIENSDLSSKLSCSTTCCGVMVRDPPEFFGVVGQAVWLLSSHFIVVVTMHAHYMCQWYHLILLRLVSFSQIIICANTILDLEQV